MAASTYKMTQVVGVSDKSFEDAIQAAVKRASKTLHGLSWFEVAEFRGSIGPSGKVDKWQVKVDIGFKLD